MLPSPGCSTSGGAVKIALMSSGRDIITKGSMPSRSSVNVLPYAPGTARGRGSGASASRASVTRSAPGGPPGGSGAAAIAPNLAGLAARPVPTRHRSHRD